jgi:formylglycine-generating enzyme required for sulfatase activity
VLGHANRVLELKPGEGEARDLVTRATEARTRALRERERAARRGLLRRVAAAGLVLGLLAAGAVAWLLDGKRREAEAAERRAAIERDRAEAEKAAKEEALAEVLRLADVKKVRDLLAEAEGLWPVHPDRAPAMADWMARVRDLLESRKAHEAALAALRERALPYTEEERHGDYATEFEKIERISARLRAWDEERAKIEEDPPEDAEAKLAHIDEQRKAAGDRISALEGQVEERVSWRFEDPADAWQQEVLADLVAGLRKLADGEAAVLRTVEASHALAAGPLAESIDGHREAWQRSIAGIAKSPAYGGLAIEPILGLLPLGEDPESGLYEFAHLGSGTVPVRDAATGKLGYAEDAAIVLVLLPGGAFRMGAQREDPEGPNYDPDAAPDESPVRQVTVRPFLLAKHECTQAQWAALTGGERPSLFDRGSERGGRRVTDRNPVENVAWDDEVMLWLRRHRLRLPSEAEWEYACRAGTETPWVTGRETAALGEVANLADAYAKGHGGHPQWRYTEEVDDGHAVHAPVGSYRANAFGLFDMHGNVFEWCWDWYRGYGDGPTDGTAQRRPRGPLLRVYRGGCFSHAAVGCRSARRGRTKPSHYYSTLGFRPALRGRVPPGE